MKSYNEIADKVLSIRDKYDKDKRHRKKKTAIALSCFVLIFVLGLGLKSLEQISDPDISVKDTTVSEAVTDNQPTATEEETTKLPDELPTNDTGGYSSYFFIPAVPQNREIAAVGEAITDTEAQAYFEENKTSILGALSSSGVPIDSVRISKKGYCHISYTGAEGESLELVQNSRDYLVHNGDELIAIVTLFKLDGEIFNTPSFGASWFDDYNDYLKAHEGERLVYVYAKYAEIIIAPDNTCYNPMGLDAPRYLEGIDNPYELFYNESAVYTP